MALSIRGSEVKALRSGMADDCTGSVLVHESYFTERGGEGNVFANVYAPEPRMRFQWFEQNFIDGGYDSADAEIRRIAITGKMLDGSKGKRIHVDEFGNIVDADPGPTDGSRPELQQVLKRAFAILVEGKLKEPTQLDLVRETKRNLEGLARLERNLREGSRFRTNFVKAEVLAETLGCDPDDGARFLERLLGYGEDSAELFVRSVMGEVA